MRVFVCDDEPKILSDISDRVKELLPDSDVRAFLSGSKLLEELEREDCQILLLDIDMPEIDGLQIADKLKKDLQKPLLVFVTSHDELVYDSLQFHPFGFVRKSFLETELNKVLLDCRQELCNRERCFFFHSKEGENRLLLSDILYLEANGNYLRLVSRDRTYHFRDTLLAVEKTLGDVGFVRIHKGFLVNQAMVKRLASGEVELMNGTVLPVGRSYAETAKRTLMRFMMR